MNSLVLNKFSKTRTCCLFELICSSLVLVSYASFSVTLLATIFGTPNSFMTASPWGENLATTLLLNSWFSNQIFSNQKVDIIFDSQSSFGKNSVISDVITWWPQLSGKYSFSLKNQVKLDYFFSVVCKMIQFFALLLLHAFLMTWLLWEELQCFPFQMVQKNWKGKLRYEYGYRFTKRYQNSGRFNPHVHVVLFEIF